MKEVSLPRTSKLNYTRSAALPSRSTLRRREWQELLHGTRQHQLAAGQETRAPSATTLRSSGSIERMKLTRLLIVTLCRTHSGIFNFNSP